MSFYHEWIFLRRTELLLLIVAIVDLLGELALFSGRRYQIAGGNIWIFKARKSFELC
jgi:hypothetical protein